MESKSPILRAAWARFHDIQDVARQMVEGTERFDEPTNRAQAFLALHEAQAMAYNWIIAPRLDNPRVFTHTAWSTYLYSLAGNSPDIVYSIIPVDGRHRYRLSGHRGDVRLMLIQVFNSPMGTQGGRTIGNHEFRRAPGDSDVIDIELAPGPVAEGNVGLDGDSGYNIVIVRRFVTGDTDDPGRLQIAMLDPPAVYDELSEPAMARRIDMAADFYEAIVKSWIVGFHEFARCTAGDLNQWALIPGAEFADIAGSATSNCAFLPYELGEDEVAVIEMQPPAGDAAYWSLQILDAWCKSLDFIHAQTDLNMLQASVDGDGIVRAVISLHDPGIVNWLDPRGRRQGICVMRNYCAENFPHPTVRIVEAAELESLLPQGTRRSTPLDRERGLARRRSKHLRLNDG